MPSLISQVTSVTLSLTLASAIVTFASKLTWSHSGKARHCGYLFSWGSTLARVELGAATLPRVLYVDRPLWAGFARGAGSHFRHCHRVPQRVALYAFLSCLWRKFRLAKRCHHKLNLFVLYHPCVPFILLSRSLSSLIPLYKNKITT